MKRLMLVAMLVVLVLSSCAPLRWVGLLPERSSTSDAPNAEADVDEHPFPWGWLLGTGLLAAAAFVAATLWAPSLRDEIVGAALAIVAVKVALALLHEAWASKWEILITVAVMAAGGTAWNYFRKKWKKPSSDSLGSPSSAPPSS